ncbi:MAG: hypothetical protein ACYS1E_13010 [Planctomycetota bacterium]|jgi:hypothetical protein
MIGDPTLQFLWFEGCPDAEAVRANLVEAVERLGLTGRIQSVDLRKLPPDDPRLCWGSPTVLVNGADLMGEPPPSPRGLCCRIYRDGKPPGVDEIADRLTTLCGEAETRD